MALSISGKIPLAAQKVQSTEKEAQLEGRFIEANRDYVIGKYDKAEEILLAVIKENETIGAAHFELAKVYEAKGDDQKAVGSINRAITLEKTNKWYLIHKLKLLDKMNDHVAAAKVCEALIEFEPNNPQNYYDKAYHELQSDNSTAALITLEKLETKLGPQIAIAEKKIMIYQALQQEDKIIATINALTQSFPENIKVLQMKASYLVNHNKAIEATEIYRKILTLDPSNVEAKIAMSAGLKVEGKDIEFITSLKELFVNKNVPFDTKMKELVPYIQKVADKKDRKLASAILDALQLLDQSNPQNAKTYAAMGDIYQNTDSIKTAIEMYSKALLLDKSIYSVWEQLLFLLQQVRDNKSLLKYANELLDIFPNLSTAYYWHALANNKNNNPETAISDCNQGLVIARKSPVNQYKLLIELGNSYSLKNDQAKCEDSFNQAIQLNSSAEWAYYSFALALAKINPGNAKSIEMADLALKIAPQSMDALAAKGFLLMKAGKFSDARIYYDKALLVGGKEYPQILEEYGDLLNNLHDFTNADLYWNLAQEKGIPNNNLSKKINAKKL